MPRSSRLEDLNSPPAINLIGSPKPELLVQALRTGSALLSSEPVAEREFLGRKIYSLKMIPMTGFERGKPQALALHFAASGAYVAMATDGGALEEYLRTGEATGKSLRKRPAWRRRRKKSAARTRAGLATKTRAKAFGSASRR